MFQADIQAGIRAHQKIDVYSDNHPVCRAARQRLQPPYRRFAGILLDVYFDHFLARGWSRHGDGTALAEFAQKRYEILVRYRDLPSKRFRLVVDAMTRGQLARRLFQTGRGREGAPGDFEALQAREPGRVGSDRPA